MKAVLASVGKNMKTRLAGFRGSSIRFSSGYTIIEVMIVLAVSGIIFAAGIVVLGGQSNETGFDQSMQDANSELANLIHSAASSQFLNSQGYDCKVTGSPPRATISGGGSSGNGGVQNQDCVVIGSAVEAPTGTSTIYNYEVLGNRLGYVNGVAAGPVNSLAEANPTTSIASSTSLMTSYKLASDATIVSSTAVTSGGDVSTSNLIGYYIDFNGQEASNGSNQLTTAEAYDYKSSSHDPTTIKTCIETSSCSQPSTIATWKLCFQSASGGRQAEIDISSQPNGATTNLKFVNCAS